jgi:hypothetical protein
LPRPGAIARQLPVAQPRGIAGSTIGSPQPAGGRSKQRPYERMADDEAARRSTGNTTDR